MAHNLFLRFKVVPSLCSLISPIPHQAPSVFVSLSLFLPPPPHSFPFFFVLFFEWLQVSQPEPRGPLNGGGGTENVLIKVHSTENPELSQFSSFQPGVGWNIALHALPAASNSSLLISTLFLIIKFHFVPSTVQT